MDNDSGDLGRSCDPGSSSVKSQDKLHLAQDEASSSQAMTETERTEWQRIVQLLSHI